MLVLTAPTIYRRSTSIDAVQNSIHELKAKKEWYSKQERVSVPTAVDTRKATEKAWQKLRRGDVATGPKKNGKLDISSDKFAPLSNGGSTSDVNEMQGQMAPEEEIVVEEEAVKASA